MQRIKLAENGPEFSRLVWGVWKALDEGAFASPEALAAMIHTCISQGITTFDNAAIYGGFRTEEFFGKALKAARVDRSKIEIVTKCGIAAPNAVWPLGKAKHYDTSSGHIAASLDRSLSLLGVDYVDLLLIHRADPFMDADDTAKGLEAAIAAGKTRFVGVSNFSASQFRLLQSRLSVPLVTNQIEFSLLHTDPLYDGVLDQAQELRRRPMVWSPLGSGRLFSGKDETATRLRDQLAGTGGIIGSDDIAAVALAWLMAHPSMPIPILGTNRPERVIAMAKAAALPMPRRQWFRLLEAAHGAPVP